MSGDEDSIGTVGTSGAALALPPHTRTVPADESGRSGTTPERILDTYHWVWWRHIWRDGKCSLSLVCQSPVSPRKYRCSYLL